MNHIHENVCGSRVQEVRKNKLRSSGWKRFGFGRVLLLMLMQASLGSVASAQNAELNGDFAFIFTGVSGSAANSSVLSVVGRFRADGAGNITNGELDINGVGPGQSQTAQPFTGSYSIGTDHRGSMTFNIGGGTAKLAFVMKSDGNALFIEFDAAGGSGTIGSGTIEKVDTTAYSTAKIAGDYAFGIAGLDNSNNRAAIAGRFSANGAGTLSNAAGDVNAYGSVSSLTFSSATYAVSDASTGRGTMNLSFQFAGGPASLNFVFYVVNSGKLLMMERDSVTAATPLLHGVAMQQHTPAGGFSNASLNGNMVFYLAGLSTCPNITGRVPKATAGLLTADGIGALGLTFDENFCRAPNSATGAPGAYTVSSNGRVAINLGSDGVVAYLIDLNLAFLFSTDTSVLSGFGEPQASGPLANSAVSGSYAGFASEPVGFGENVFSGEFTADGASPTGNMNGVADIGAASGPTSAFPFSSTYSISSSPTNGRGTFSLTSPSGTAVAYVISPSKFVMVYMNDANPAVWVFEQPSTAPAPTLVSLSLNPTTVNGGSQSSVGTVNLSGPAPAGGAQVTLSSNGAAATPPSSVLVPGAATSATFTITTRAVSTSTLVTISASYGGTTRTATLTVSPAPVPPSITTQPASRTVTAGQMASFSVVATGTAPLGYQWKRNNVVISGATSSSYTTPATTTSDNGAQFTVVVSNSAGSVTSSAAMLTVTPPQPTISSLSLNPTSVIGGLGSSTGTVTLSGPAPAGGAQIVLSSSSGAASVPSSITVPAGATSATFTVSTSIVLISTSVTISASYNGTTRTATLSVLL